MRIQSLRLEEKLVCGLIGKFDDLVLDRRTISRANRLNLATVHRRAMHVLANDAVRFGRGPGYIARHLLIVMRYALGAKTERRGIGIARLNLKLRPINRAAIEPRRGPSLQAAPAQAEVLQRLAE